MAESQLGLNQVVRMVAQAQKRPENRLVLKLKGLLLSCQPYLKKDGTTSYQMQFFHNETESLIKFYGPDPIEKGKPVEIEFLLTGFNASVLRRPGSK